MGFPPGGIGTKLVLPLGAAVSSLALAALGLLHVPLKVSLVVVIVTHNPNGDNSKLLGAIGLWLGWAMLPAVLLLAALTGLTLVLVGQLTGRPARLDDRVPFGALLAIAAYPAWLFLLGSAT